MNQIITFICMLIFCVHTAFASKMLYIGAYDVPGINDLYLIDITTDGNSVSATLPVKVNAPLSLPPPDLNEQFATTLGVNEITETIFTDIAIYQVLVSDDPSVLEIYMTKLDTPGVSVRLNAPLLPDVSAFLLDASSDSQKIIYIESLANSSFSAGRLLSTELVRPGVATELNAPLEQNEFVGRAIISPGNTYVAYETSQNGLVKNIMLVRFDAPGLAFPVSPIPTNAFIVGDMTFSPDGSRLFFHLAQELPAETANLYVVDVAQPNNVRVLNHPLPPTGAVSANFDLNSDGSKVTYVAQDAPGLPMNIFVVDPANPGISTKLNPDLAGAPPSTFLGIFSAIFGAENAFFSADDQHVIYNARQELAEVRELYQVPVGVPGQSFKLNAPFDQPTIDREGIFMMAPTPDGRFIIYVESFGAGDFQPPLTVIDRLNPGVAISPFDFSSNTSRSLGFAPSQDSRMISFNVEEGAGPLTQGDSSLMVALVDKDNSAIIVSLPQEGLSPNSVGAWIPDTGPAFGPLPLSP